jgi:lipoprotein signal peptidase
MNRKCRAILVLGYLMVVAACFLALRLIQALIFRTITTFWTLASDLLFAALVIYLIYVGRRGIAYARGTRRPKPRFGWGRILLGAILLYNSANAHFHLTPTRQIIKPLEPSNEAQALGMNAADIVLAIGCVVLILSGIWAGIRRKPNKHDLSALSNHVLTVNRPESGEPKCQLRGPSLTRADGKRY